MNIDKSADESATGWIRIKERPPKGEAPLWVLEAWIGLTLPCHPYCGYPDGELERGVLSGKKASRNRRGFIVPQDEAIKILERERPSAAAYWREKGFPEHNKCFCFGEDEAEIVGGVTRQFIREVSDEMGGHPDR